MWCKNCGQDLPAIASNHGGAVRCVRCRSLVGSPLAATTALDLSNIRQSADHGLELDKPLASESDLRLAEPVRSLPSLTPPRLSEPLDALESWTLANELQRIRRRSDVPPTETAGAAVPLTHLDHLAPRGNITYQNAGFHSPNSP